MTEPRWYMVNKDGMATLCTSKKDAEKEARAMDMAWPHMGPHRAVQLVDAADVEAMRAGYAAARLEIESLQARIKTMAEERADELTVAHLDGRMRAAQPVGAQQPSPTPQADSVLEDSALLDWLDLAGPVSICLVVDREHDGEVEVSTDDVTGYGKTVRAAIDAARATQEGKK